MTLNRLDHGVDDLDVHLLNPVRSRRGNHDRVVGQTFELSAVPSEEADRRNAMFFCGLKCANHVLRISARRKTHKHIALASHADQLAGENLIKTVIIRYASYVTRIAKSERTEWGAVFAVTAGEFFCEMHRITVTAPIAARKELAAVFEQSRQHF